MAMRRFLLLAVAVLGALMLSSCTQLEFSAEALMNAPVLTPEQTEIKEALKSHLGVEESSIVFKYPRTGDFRSAFVMYDLDRDGKDEAIVFYSLRDMADNKAFINVLAETDKGWVSTCNVGGLSSNVDLVEFTNVVAQGNENLIVGWSSPGGGERIVSVYSFDEKQLLVREYKGSYTEMLVCDINKDGLDNLLLLRANEVSQNASVVMVAPSAKGDLKDTARLTLDEGITGFGKVQVGKLSGTTEAVFIDAQVESEYITYIVRYNTEPEAKNLLVDVVAGLDKSVQTTFRRPEAVFCADINGDGLIEIPTMTELPGYGPDEIAYAYTPMYATEYLSVTPSGMTPVWYGVVNVKAGYRFEFPDNWSGEVTASMEGNKLHFFVYRGDIYDMSEELLMILTGAVNDKNDTTEYRVLDTVRGVFYAAIPRVENKEMKLTFAQVQQRFSIVQQ